MLSRFYGLRFGMLKGSGGENMGTCKVAQGKSLGSTPLEHHQAQNIARFTFWLSWELSKH